MKSEKNTAGFFRKRLTSFCFMPKIKCATEQMFGKLGVSYPKDRTKSTKKEKTSPFFVRRGIRQNQKKKEGKNIVGKQF